MYNGIGLPTPRGSGTNGFVTRNVSSVPTSKLKPQVYLTKEDVDEEKRRSFRGPNADIIEHQRKRKIELKCFELEELMREKGYESDEILEKVTEYRESLTQQDEERIKQAQLAGANQSQTDRWQMMGNEALLQLSARQAEENLQHHPTAIEARRQKLSSHEMAAAKITKNQAFRSALRIDEDRAKLEERKRKLDEQKIQVGAKQLLEKSFKMLESSSSSEDAEPVKEKKKKEKKKKNKKKDSQLEEKDEKKKRKYEKEAKSINEINRKDDEKEERKRGEKETSSKKKSKHSFESDNRRAER